MLKDAFEDLCICIRQTWTLKEGVLVKLNQSSVGQKELTLCVGGYRNPYLVAGDCVLWDKDSQLYDGPFQCRELRSLLTSNHVCFGEITSAKLLEHGRRGMFKCFKDPAICKNHKCRLCKSKQIQMTEEVTAQIL